MAITEENYAPLLFARSRGGKGISVPPPALRPVSVRRAPDPHDKEFA